jgi:hypothetical protein
MARSKTPGPLERRHLLEEALTPAKAKAIAEGYLAENRPFDALAFLAKAGETDRLRALQGDAVGQGDLFLVREIGALLGEDPDAERLAAARSGERPRAR